MSVNWSEVNVDWSNATPFALKLRERIEGRRFDHEILDGEEIRAFLKVETDGLTLSVHHCDLTRTRVLLLSGMILAIVEIGQNHLIPKWCGPTFEADSGIGSEQERYKKRYAFLLEIDKQLVDGINIRYISADQVFRMPHRAPAILYVESRKDF